MAFLARRAIGSAHRDLAAGTFDGGRGALPRRHLESHGDRGHSAATPALRADVLLGHGGPARGARRGARRHASCRTGAHSPMITSFRWAQKPPAVIRYMNTPERNVLPSAPRRSHSTW